MDDAVTLGRFYQLARARFTEHAIMQPALDARLLICAALNLTHEQFILQGTERLDHAQMAKAEALLQQRLLGRPVAKIIGFKEFYDRPFKTNEATLDPRPDSETLIDAVLRHVDKQNHLDKKNHPQSQAMAPLRILDLGTGTGCLALTLLAELPHAQALAVDISNDALAVARENAALLDVADRIAFLQSNWLDKVTGRFDIIISNPPYIPDADIADLAIEVRQFDPHNALAGGQDGLDPYRLIIPQLHDFLDIGGLAAFELGQGQDQIIVKMLQEEGFSDIETLYDLGGIGRVVKGVFLPKMPE